jgi:hypothetical protein
MTLAAGDKLGPYEILALLGASGMGEVFRARDNRLPKSLFGTRIPPELHFDISPDGKRFLIPSTVGDSTSRMVVLNWHAGVKK